MNADTTGRNLFIVDNSVSVWTGLRYLKECGPESHSTSLSDYSKSELSLSWPKSGNASTEFDSSWVPKPAIGRDARYSTRSARVQAMHWTVAWRPTNKATQHAPQLTVAARYARHSDADFLRWYFSSLDLHPDYRRRCTLLVDPGRGNS